MTKSLLYLIKLSVLPILALIGGKLLGFVLAGSFLGVDVHWVINTPLDILTPIVPIGEIRNVTTFADLFMYGLLAVGMSIVLIQSSFFHDSHVDINAVSKLADYNLLGIIKSSYHLYHWGFIWGIYMIIGSVVIIIDYFLGSADLWAAVITAFFSVFSIMILVKDVYNEIETAKKITSSKS